MVLSVAAGVTALVLLCFGAGGGAGPAGVRADADADVWRWREVSAAAVTELAADPWQFHRKPRSWPAAPAVMEVPVALANGTLSLHTFALPRATWDSLRSMSLCLCGGEASALPLLTPVPPTAPTMCASDARRECRDFVSNVWRELLSEHENKSVMTLFLPQGAVKFRRGDDVVAFAFAVAVDPQRDVLPSRNFTAAALRRARAGAGAARDVSSVDDAADATAHAARIAMDLANTVVKLVQSTVTLPEWTYLWNREPAHFPFPFQSSQYLHLLRNALTGAVLRDKNMDPFMPHEFDWTMRLLGRDWPTLGVTMIGLSRILNTHFALADTVASGVPGDFFEAGVWRGGACIFAHAFYSELELAERRVVWLADSFAGLPPPKPDIFPADTNDNHHTLDEYLAVSAADVAANFALFGFDVSPAATDGPVRFLKGFFSDTLPMLPLRRVSVMRVDGDMYESTWVTLQTMFPRLSVGGYVICDDVVLPSSRKAVVDYRTLLGLSTDVDPLVPIDIDGAYWRRGPGPVMLGSSAARVPLYLQLLSLPAVQPPLALVHSRRADVQLELSLHRAVWGVRTVRFVPQHDAAAASELTRAAGLTVNAGVEPRRLHVSCRASSPSPAALSSSVPVHVAAAMLRVDALDVVYMDPVVFVNDDASRVAADGSVSADERSTCDRVDVASRAGTLPVCQLLTRFDDAKAALTAWHVAPGAGTPHGSVEQSATLRTLRELQLLGFELAFVDAASGEALLINAAFCDALSLRVATEYPTGSGSVDAAPPLVWDPVLSPALLARLRRGDVDAARQAATPSYTTAVVITVAGSERFAVARRAVDNAYHFVRRPAVVVLVVRNPRDTMLHNLRLLFPALVWVASDEHEPVAAAWNRAVAAVTAQHAPHVLLFLSDDARIDFSIVSLTDAAAAARGPHAPMTNAPKRGQTRSPMFAVRGTWQAMCEATPRVCAGGAASLLTLPLTPDTLALHAVSSRAFAASVDTLRVAAATATPVTSPGAAPSPSMYFDVSVPAFDVDVAWTRRWMAASGEASPATHLVRSAFVWHTSVSDTADADAAFTADHELCGVDSAPFPYPLWP